MEKKTEALSVLLTCETDAWCDLFTWEMSQNTEQARMQGNSITGGEKRVKEKRREVAHRVPGKIWSANGSRKRILILILHTQILLYSPTILCYSTLRRQKPSASHISDPSRPSHVRVQILCCVKCAGSGV